LKTVNLIVSQFYPEKSAGTNRALSIVKTLSTTNIINVIYLVERGKEVNMYDIKKEFNSNVNLYPILQKKYKTDSFIQRVFYETFYSIKLNLKNLLVKSDVTIISIPLLMLLPVSGFFSLFYRRKKIIEIRDLIWLYLDFSQKKALQKAKLVLEKVCLWAVNRFDSLVTTTKSQLDYFNQEGIVIGNGIEKSKFEELSILEYPNITDKIYITYAGTIGFPQNLMTFVEAANLVKDKDKYVFKLAGKGNDLNQVLKYIEDNSLSNIHYVGELNWEELKNEYAKSHILYAQIKDTMSFRTAQPSKIFEYASTGFPIIFGGIGESEMIIKSMKNCVNIVPDNPNEIIKHLKEIDLKISKKNIEYIKANYIREELSMTYSSIIE
jgi:hypothetical protein